MVMMPLVIVVGSRYRAWVVIISCPRQGPAKVVFQQLKSSSTGRLKSRAWWRSAAAMLV